MKLTPYRMVFASGAQFVQFHETIDQAIYRARSLAMAYFSDEPFTVWVDRGFFPQGPGLREFGHVKQVVEPIGRYQIGEVR